MKQPDKTRETIIKAALQEVHRKGFNSTSLKDILTNTGLTKGALYHHFASKISLGHALLDKVEEEIRSRWLVPLQECSDPLACLGKLMTDIVETDEIEWGCPLHNLAQEMSSLDEPFRARIASIYHAWREGIMESLLRGQENGMVTRRIDAEATAMFFIAALSGIRGLAKAARSMETLRCCLQCLVQYLESIRT